MAVASGLYFIAREGHLAFNVAIQVPKVSPLALTSLHAGDSLPAKIAPQGFPMPAMNCRVVLLLFACVAMVVPLCGTSIELLSPSAGVFVAPARIELTAEVAVEGETIDHVEFLADDVLVGSDASPEGSIYSVLWEPTIEGRSSLTARAYMVASGTVDSSPVVVTVGRPKRDCLLVIGVVASTVGDDAIRARIESLGFVCTVIQARLATSADGDGRDLIFISESVSSSDVTSKFRDTLSPVICSEDYNYDDMLMTGPTVNTDYGFVADQSTLAIPATASPLTAGLTTGTLTLFTSPGRTQWGIPNGNALVGAEMPVEPQKKAVFGYRTGAAMFGMNAPARRTGFFLQDFTKEMTLLTPEGLRLFDAAVRWTSSDRELEGIPAAPANLRSDASTSGTLHLEWDDLADNEDGFELEQSTDGVSFTLQCRFDAEVSSVLDTIARPAVVYFRVRAFNGDGDSPWSNVIQVGPPDDPSVWVVR